MTQADDNEGKKQLSARFDECRAEYDQLLLNRAEISSVCQLQIEKNHRLKLSLEKDIALQKQAGQRLDDGVDALSSDPLSRGDAASLALLQESYINFKLRVETSQRKLFVSQRELDGLQDQLLSNQARTQTVLAESKALQAELHRLQHTPDQDLGDFKRAA